MNGTMTMAFKGPLNNPTEVIISIPEFSYIDTLEDDNFTMKDFSITGTNLIHDGDEITDGVITVSGAISGISDGETLYTVVDKFTVTITSTSGGINRSVSGRIKPICIDGWVTVTTTTPIFIPKLADCPTNGEITITAGGKSIRVKAASNYEVSILLNDNPVNIYDNCNDVMGHCEEQ